uniref:C2 domain-containing protein n=1 Tax=Romanomermis culicivorax TaxID=13658 RepID=A0A915I1X8_ROMCU
MDETSVLTLLRMLVDQAKFPDEDLPIEPTLPILPDIDRLPVEKPSLKIGLSYDKDKNELKIVLTSASNLPDRLLPFLQRKGDSATTSCCSTESDKTASGSTSTSNQQIVLEPFVKVKFLPEKQQRYKSKIVKGTLNPIFDETFTFKNVSISQLQSSTIHFSVLSTDKYSTDDDLVGEAICSLNSVDLSQSNKKVALNLTLLNSSFKFQSSANRGDLLISLCYSPSARKITVVLLKARNLPTLDSSGFADPQVKISMYYNNDILLKQKSRVVRRTLDPTFNETFDFSLMALPAMASPSKGGKIFPAATTSEKSAAPENLSFDFEIFNHDRMKKSQFLGHVIVGEGNGAVPRKNGNATNNNDKEHLDEIFRRPLKQITQWHRLKARASFSYCTKHTEKSRQPINIKQNQDIERRESMIAHTRNHLDWKKNKDCRPIN